MHYIIESFIIIIIILGILVGTGMMLCCMAASTDREKDDAEQRELLRLIEVGASCFNHYCAGYDDT